MQNKGVLSDEEIDIRQALLSDITEAYHLLEQQVVAGTEPVIVTGGVKLKRSLSMDEDHRQKSRVLSVRSEPDSLGMANKSVKQIPN